MESNVMKNLQSEKQNLLTQRQTLLEAFAKCAIAGKQKRLSQLFIMIRQTNEFLQSLDRLEKSHPIPSGRRRYAISSLFLHESFRMLTADRDEQFFFITGSEINGVFVLDQAAEFAHQKRSIAGVTGDSRSTHNLLIKLDHFGHRLLGHFHSHPGKGAGATNPSGTDENFQRRLESAGHVAVMAIFSRDGYFRFLRLDQNLEIEIYGNGVEKHAAGIYRLTNIDPA